MVLKYIYTGELELKKYPGEIILGLLVASDELLLGELFEHVQDYLFYSSYQKSKNIILKSGCNHGFNIPNNRKQYLSTKESFIFSFENNEDIKNMKISRVINSSYAICNTGNGVNFGGTDLNLENDYLSLSYSGNYENLDINLERNESLMDMDYLYGNLYDGINRHEVEEIEFFRVKKIK
ncbi:unnamed protein product [Rhizophagus irregularis]|nr:unnamed protein product [Rhizophagus irregularis]